jgi:hypothetical protein
MDTNIKVIDYFSYRVKNICVVFLSVIILFLENGCGITKIESATKVPFFKISGIPVVEGKINGKLAYFIIDTGATCSVLNQSKAKHFRFTYADRFREYTLKGIGGDAQLKPVYNCNIEFGLFKISNVTFRTKDLNYLTNAIEKDSFTEITGIIGADVLMKYNIMIDYALMLISFRALSNY